jgi:hypothetical protein
MEKVNKDKKKVGGMIGMCSDERIKEDGMSI